MKNNGEDINDGSTLFFMIFLVAICGIGFLLGHYAFPPHAAADMGTATTTLKEINAQVSANESCFHMALAQNKTGIVSSYASSTKDDWSTYDCYGLPMIKLNHE